MDIALRVLEKTPSVQGRSKPILTLLVILSAAIALPLVLLTVTVGLRFANAERRVIEAQRLDVATSLSHLVDGEIAGVTAFMVALASSADARNGSYEALAQITSAAGIEHAPLQLFVTDRGGKRLYATAGSSGTLPADIATLGGAFDGKPVVSNYVESGKAALFFVSVPITLSAVVLVLVIIGAILKDRANFFGYFQQVGLAALTFNLVSLAVGYAAPRLLRMSRPQAIAIGMEVGIHNGTLAIAIAASPFLLNNRTMAIPPAIYSLIMFITAAAFGFLTSARRAPSSPRAATAR